jgi:hypothetical protein
MTDRPAGGRLTFILSVSLVESIRGLGDIGCSPMTPVPMVYPTRRATSADTERTRSNRGRSERNDPNMPHLTKDMLTNARVDHLAQQQLYMDMHGKAESEFTRTDTSIDVHDTERKTIVASMLEHVGIMGKCHMIYRMMIIEDSGIEKRLKQQISKR